MADGTPLQTWIICLAQVERLKGTPEYEVMGVSLAYWLDISQERMQQA